MDYAQQQRNPGKHTVGIGIVIAMHLLLAWALVSGLARKMVDVIKAPIETKIIEEVQPPPPPPPENLPPPPKFAPPPPSFVPPPEVVVNNPPPAPTITVTRDVPPPAPPVSIAPAGPPGPPHGGRGASGAASAAAAGHRQLGDARQGRTTRLPPRRAEATGATTCACTVGADGKLISAEVVRVRRLFA